MYLADAIFPSNTVTTVTGGVTTMITDNIVVILGVLAFFLGLAIVRAWLNHSRRGKM